MEYRIRLDSSNSNARRAAATAVAPVGGSSPGRYSIMVVLRVIILLVLLSVLMWTLARSDWWGKFSDGNRTRIIHLPKAPAWAPPDLPTYDEFRRTFPDLPAEQRPHTTITCTFQLEWVANAFFLRLWGASCLICLICYAILDPKQRRDLVVRCVLGLAVGLTVGAAICFVAWATFGGWGPPAPWLFGSCCSFCGLLLALLSGKRQSPTPPAR
jgi:hypothetical protein